MGVGFKVLGWGWGLGLKVLGAYYRRMIVVN